MIFTLHKRCYFASALIVCLTVGVSSAQTLDLPKLKRLVPYLEAEGKPSPNTKIAWLSGTQVIFTSADKPPRYEEKGNTEIRHFDETHKVLIFDVETGNTTLYREGLLWAYEDGVITIELKQVRKKISRTDSDDKFKEYDLRVKGTLGKEKLITDYVANNIPSPRKCPTNSESISDGVTARLLKPEHGCIQTPDLLARNGKPWVYFRSDGQKVSLPIPPGDEIGQGIWIQWIGAYLLGDFVVMGRNIRGVNSPSLKLMKPDGTLLIVPMNEWGLNNARPTRAGMVATRYLPALPRDHDGIYLWHNGQVLQIAEGIVSPSGLEVNSDGCRIAYLWHLRFTSTTPQRVRTIDICKSLGVTRDAHPFNF